GVLRHDVAGRLQGALPTRGHALLLGEDDAWLEHPDHRSRARRMSEVLQLPADVTVRPPWWVDEATTTEESVVPARSWFSRWWPWLLAGVAFAVYLIIGLVLLFKIGYAIGDSVVRESQARSVVDSRDPHAASIGFYWMPIPVLSQLPLAAVLSRLGVSEASGPLSTALWAAGTIPVLVAIGRRLRLHDGWTALLVVIFAFNPWTIFYAANGMSEASFFFFLALTCLGYISWIKEGRLRDLALLGLALS